MKILLANYWLEDIGGTEKWTYAMACEMQRLGHEVTVFTLAKGITSEQIEHKGITVIDKVPVGESFDMQMINHNPCLKLLGNVPGFKVFTSHGPQHPMEEPVAGAHRYAAVSAEVRARYAPFHPVVIENGIDLDEFKPIEMEDNKHPVVLSVAKAGKATKMVKEAVEAVGMVFMSVHYLDAPVWNMARLMQNADIVVASGRSAYEALACGKQVLQFDWRDPRGGPLADGWVFHRNVDNLRYFNIAGRGNAFGWTVDDLKGALLMYDGPNDWARGWAEKNCDIREKAQRYLQLKEEY